MFQEFQRRGGFSAVCQTNITINSVAKLSTIHPDKIRVFFRREDIYKTSKGYTIPAPSEEAVERLIALL